jgi:hypothetical protein
MRSKYAAEDVAAARQRQKRQVMIAAWRGIATYSDDSNITAWVRSIVKNKQKDALRAKYADPELDAMELDEMDQITLHSDRRTASVVIPGEYTDTLHADLTRHSEDAPLIGFILMIDSFREENGATRFVPTSHKWIDLPSDRLADTRDKCSGEVLGCGDRGAMIIFNGAIWHGHTANVTSDPRRSIQGYFVRRTAGSGMDFSRHLTPATHLHMSPFAHYLLALDKKPHWLSAGKLECRK